MLKKQKIKHETYNDGFVEYGNIQIVRNDKKVKISEEIKAMGKLPFELMSIRDNDNIIADSLGYTIDKKIKVPYRNLPENIKITINNEKTIYDIVKRDSSDKISLYLYLQIASNRGNVR